ncbi:TatD family hydrolase [Candidatus Roizmanbacteria bacterium]|jgi:TatD DNase family protein|nr:TatD family hydrolase [Candidatus Roizmanbacteria bacterium]
MFDTHCHLNFETFDDKLEPTIALAKKAGVGLMVTPGTNLENSREAVSIAEKNAGIFAAVGIHPHHLFEIFNTSSSDINFRQNFIGFLDKIEALLKHEKVVAVGEVGLDRHLYTKTKYAGYQVEKEFMNWQRYFLRKQVTLAISGKKSLILHNREAIQEFLSLLDEVWDDNLSGRAVFHCCEPDDRLLEFAIRKKVYMGVDGDVTYQPKKQIFIKKIPLDLLVLETDSPFLLPHPLKKNTDRYNQPANLPIIAGFIAKILGKKQEEIEKITTDNAQDLFQIGKN